MSIHIAPPRERLDIEHQLAERHRMEIAEAVRLATELRQLERLGWDEVHVAHGDGALGARP